MVKTRGVEDDLHSSPQRPLHRPLGAMALAVLSAGEESNERATMRYRRPMIAGWPKKAGTKTQEDILKGVSSRESRVRR